LAAIRFVQNDEQRVNRARILTNPATPHYPPISLVGR
jgi:hypothetical protein